MRRGAGIPARSSDVRRPDGRDSPAFLPSTAALLCEGGDQRIRLDPLTGLNRYGCGPTPDPDLLAFGSSTASTISVHAWEAAEALRARLIDALAASSPSDVYEREAVRIRGELVRLCGLERLPGLEAALAASGTDAHMLVAQLIGAGDRRPVRIILGEAGETGSGVPAALGGRCYGASTPCGTTTEPGAAISEATAAELVHVPARDPDGRLRDCAAVDAEVRDEVARAMDEGRRVLLVVTDASKTGLISPSAACARALDRQYAGRIDVLVDACQLRLAPSTLRAYAQDGWMIAVTGSKFLTGPAFSGALFFPGAIADRLRDRLVSPRLSAFSARGDWPRGWVIRARLDARANFGLLLRWEAALEELRRFRDVPESAVDSFLGQAADLVGEILSVSPNLRALPGRPMLRAGGDWDRQPSIHPFMLTFGGVPLNGAQTARLYDLLRKDLGVDDEASATLRGAASQRMEVGQPVLCGDGQHAVSALRLCISARHLAEAHRDSLRRCEILEQITLILHKADWLCAEVAIGRL